MPAAALWDFDGTIVDTEPFWMQAEAELIAGYGATWSHAQAMQLVGSDLLASGAFIIEQTGIPLTAPEVVEGLLDRVVTRLEREIPWRPGARELLADLRRLDIPCGLVTMSYQRFVRPVLDVLPEGTFDCVVTGEMVTDGKPHPEPYLTAARLLGVPAEECVALEDSPTGASSALAAGCRVLAVPLHVPMPEREGMVVAPQLPPDVLGLRELAGRARS